MFIYFTFLHSSKAVIKKKFIILLYITINMLFSYVYLHNASGNKKVIKFVFSIVKIKLLLNFKNVIIIIDTHMWRETKREISKQVLKTK